MSVTLHTSLGDVKVELHCDRVRLACFNFLALAAAGKYDGTKFHRNIKGFMLQGGDTTGTGKGGASIWGRPFPDEFHPDLKHNTRGVLSMANKGADTNGSQFFFTYAKQAHLDKVYTVFGRIIYGMEVLDAAEKVPTDAKDRPLEPILLNSITIHANPFAADDVVVPHP